MEIGRIALVNSGPNEGRLIVILDVVDQNRVCARFYMFMLHVNGKLMYLNCIYENYGAVLSRIDNNTLLNIAMQTFRSVNIMKYKV